KNPPRSPRVRLGGYVIVPRMLDKCRATIAGKNGEYHFNCPLDQRVFQFAGIVAEAIKAEVAKGLSDAEVMVWINANASQKRSELEIAQWSAAQDQSYPSGNEQREYFNGRVAEAKA